MLLSFGSCSLCVVGWLRADACVCLLLRFSRFVCYGVAVRCRCWTPLLILVLFVALQLLMLVELCVVVRTGGVFLCDVFIWLRVCLM